MQELANFHEQLVNIYGYNLIVRAGVAHWHRELSRLVASGNTTLSQTVIFGPDPPSDPDGKYHYERSNGDLISDTNDNGRVLVIHRRSVIVLVAALWESRYRRLIAKELGMKKKALQSSVFGDVVRYRNVILHADGTLDRNMDAIHFFEKGDQLELTDDHIDHIFRMMIDDLNRIANDYYSASTHFNFDRSFNDGPWP